MGSHATDVLEFAEVLATISELAISPAGAAAVRALKPSGSAESITSELGLVTEGLALLQSEAGWNLEGYPDLREPLARLALEGYLWESIILSSAARLIRSSRSLRARIVPLEAEGFRLAQVAAELVELPGVAERIERAIDEDGTVRDEASPELRRLRREIVASRGRIVARLNEFISRLPAHHQVPDGSISIREGRYVIPVRREGRAEVGGIIHGESQTGATLFIEPPIAIEMMNRLRELELAEVREVDRVLRALTDSLRPHAGELIIANDTLIRLDTIHARARYALVVEGSPPEILPAGEPLTIVGGRHPLLLAQGEAVVPFDLKMEQKERTLIISGPNTGGKTVLLKAMGLIVLLTRSGIVPPVAPGTRFPLFRTVFADIGDEQSIEASLSTFSAHLKNLRATLAGADSAALVLIDEIGSGTDPVEGAALARAILLELTRRGAFTIATTHLGALKLLATQDERIVNASLQFDAERLQPTYRLLKGVPGRSYGLAIARRLGLPEALLQEAEAALPAGERDVARLLLDLEARELRLTELEADLDLQITRNESLARELESREQDLQRREQDAERRARQQARDLLLQSRSEVESAIRQVRESVEESHLEEAARAARRRIEEAARRQRERIPTEGRGASPTTREPLRIGARVRIESMRRTGVLLELRDSRAIVDIDGLRMQLGADDLAMLPPGDQQHQPRSRRSPAGGHFNLDIEARPEIDLRGLRVEELKWQLGRGLDSALMAGLPSFRIIHGKGTGALRAEVQELLRADPRVVNFRPGDRFEGGTGVTIAEFQ